MLTKMAFVEQHDFGTTTSDDEQMKQLSCYLLFVVSRNYKTILVNLSKKVQRTIDELNETLPVETELQKC